MKIKGKIAAVGCALVVLCATVGCGGTKSIYDNRGLTSFEYSLQNITGTDSLGREIGTVTEQDNEKYVGMYYFLTHGSIPQSTYKNVEEMLADGLKDELFSTNSQIAPAMNCYYWNEPIFGYYHSEDEWVFRRQVAMLSWAGVDFLALDVTNGYTYDEVWWMYFRVLDEIQKTGVKVPKIVFLTNNNMNERVPVGTNVVEYLYDQIYSKGLYKDLWFSLGDKPLIIASSAPSNGPGPSEEMYEFFDIRQTVWPNDPVQNYEGFPWISFKRPQENYNGIMSVSVCQHYKTFMSNSYYYEGNKYMENWGRGWTDETGNTEEGIFSGANIGEQWETVYENIDAVDLAFVCGWNEWTAYKFVDPGINNGLPYWVDQFNNEFSRDIEPTAGVLRDNYFMQLCENIRKFKRKDTDYSIKVDPSEIDMDNESGWTRVKEQYVNITGSTMNRNFKGATADKFYTDTTGRNDIASIKVAYDENNLYFRVSTVEDITAYEANDDKWMNIYIGTPEADAWNGFGFVVNRSVNGNKTSLHSLDKDGKATLISSDIELRVSGTNSYVAIPLSLLNLDQKNINIDFKVSDNVQNQENILSHYISGCSAPIGGLSYNYKVK